MTTDLTRHRFTWMTMLALLMSAPLSAEELRPFKLPSESAKPTIYLWNPGLLQNGQALPLPLSDPPSNGRQSTDWSEWSQKFDRENAEFDALLQQLERLK